MHISPHQYIDRNTGSVHTEELIGDRILNWMYHCLRERPYLLFRALISARVSSILGWVQYDLVRPVHSTQLRRTASSLNINPSEFIKDIDRMHTFRELFERQIRYWECRPMNSDKDVIVSPSDARMILGSLSQSNGVFIKDKFFDFDELLGGSRPHWRALFRDGDVAVFRLTPDKYHYNHTPVSGYIADIYEVSGVYHACNPSATVQAVTPLSKNTRTVTVIDTDVADGTGIGYVAMIEVAALMIGNIVQCYSDVRYESPRPVRCGMFVRKGCPKSLFRPGSSTVVLLFERNRIRFCDDLVENQKRRDVSSRYSLGFDCPLTETDVSVRSDIARAVRETVFHDARNVRNLIGVIPDAATMTCCSSNR